MQSVCDDEQPHVSNDTPFSESAFKTMKHRPVPVEKMLADGLPCRTGDLAVGPLALPADVLQVEYVRYYNAARLHQGLVSFVGEAP
jgi:hypothetical protein